MGKEHCSHLGALRTRPMDARSISSLPVPRTQFDDGRDHAIFGTNCARSRWVCRLSLSRWNAFGFVVNFPSLAQHAAAWAVKVSSLAQVFLAKGRTLVKDVSI